MMGYEFAEVVEEYAHVSLRKRELKDGFITRVFLGGLGAFVRTMPTATRLRPMQPVLPMQSAQPVQPVHFKFWPENFSVSDSEKICERNF